VYQGHNLLPRRYHTGFSGYVAGTAVSVLMSYNMVTDSGRYTILPNGYYALPNNNEALLANIIVASSSHIVIFSVYLYYSYKLKQDNINAQNLNKLHKIAVAMGLTIGISTLIHLYAS